jgi:cardiolipin synthase
MFHADWVLGTLGTARGDLFALLRLALALSTTVHVLLTKRNTQSSIAWIGFSWISPVVGTALYFSFGINRVSRRARKLRRRLHRTGDEVPDGDARDDHLGALEAAARTITKRPALAGNRVERFENGDEAYPRMLAAIEAAQTSIGLASYIFFDDAGGRPFIDALARAHRRGIAVRVLVDGVGSGYFRCGAASALHAAGVPVDRFLHSVLPWRMPFINLRNHKKILVVDGRLGFTGGMNISAHNLVATNPADPVRDTHFLFEGPVVGQLTEAFAADWMFATDEELDGDAWFPDTPEDGPAIARVITAGPDQDIEKIELVMLQAIASAERGVRLMTPYFLPDGRLMTALSLAAMRGVRVDIVVPEKSDHRAVDWAARNNFGPLINAGCAIWLNPPPFDHSKIMVVDQTWALIGSTNWDSRSFRLNFELNLEVYHSDLAANLDRLVASKQGRRVRGSELRARSVPVRLRDAAMRLTQPYL